MRRRVRSSLVWWQFASLCFMAALAQAFQVSWSSPSEGQSYGPGDSIVGTWSSGKKVISPSFRLCFLGEDATAREETDYDSETDNGDCGDTVWPDVKDGQDDGSYSMSLVVPNVTSHGQFYLEMKSDLGDVHESPTFFLGTKPQRNAAVASPTSSANTTESVASTSAASSTATNPSATDSKRPPPSVAAAVAVPITLACVAALAAAVLIRARRRRRDDALASGTSTPGAAGRSDTEKELRDLEKAVQLLASLDAAAEKPRGKRSFRDVVRRLTVKRFRGKESDDGKKLQDLGKLPHPTSDRRPRAPEPAIRQPVPNRPYQLSPIEDMEEIEFTPPLVPAPQNNGRYGSRFGKPPVASRSHNSSRRAESGHHDDEPHLEVLSSYMAPSPFVSSSPYPSSPYVPLPCGPAVNDVRLASRPVSRDATPSDKRQLFGVEASRVYR